MKENFFKSLKLFVAKILGTIFNLFLKDAENVVKIVQHFKDTVEDPKADVVVAFIPGKLDDKLLFFFRKYINPVLNTLKFIYEFDADEDKGDLITAFANFLRSKTKLQRADIWARFAAEFLVAISDKRISLSEGYSLTQLAYEAIFKKKISLS